MREKDIVEKHLEDYNDVFADIINVLLFHGRRLIKENDLENSSTLSMYKADDNELHETERDVSKFWKNANVKIALCGFENQTTVDKDMPIRVIGYDGQSCRSQLLKQDDTVPSARYPVITLVLYFGLKHWDKPKTLHGCFDIPKDLLPYVSDYKINIFEIAYLTNEQVAMFTSDFKIVADYFVQMRKNKDYIPSNEEIQHVDAILKMMAVLTGDNRFTDAQQHAKGGNKTMCEVLDKVENRGIEKGLALGEERLAGLINKLLADGRTEEIALATSNQQARNKFYKEYGITC
ncbi:MAG: Rpn family recombination-promoting nuclease/putative transposase [Roseburia sp.]|nr:Rpn family recombination-promoting nuclease/putative transposase [Roseburia sp.]